VDCGKKSYFYEDSYERKHEFIECKNPKEAICYVKGKNDSDWKYNNNCKYTGDVIPPIITCDNDEDKRNNDPICQLADPKCFNVNE
jgi:hypothetical protein